MVSPFGRKPRFREGRSPAQGHPTGEWWSRISSQTSPGLAGQAGKSRALCLATAQLLLKNLYILHIVMQISA